MASPALFSAYTGFISGAEKQIGSDEDTSVVDTGQAFNGRLVDITQMWLSKNERGECFPTGHAGTSEESTTKRFGAYSLLLRRNVYPESIGKAPELQLEIQSRGLCEVLRTAAPNLRTVNLNATPIIVKAPYHELYHFRWEIEACIPAAPCSAAETLLATEIAQLTKFIDNNIGKAVMSEIQALKDVRKISAEYLWSIFKPGDMAFLRMQAPMGGQEMHCGIIQNYFVTRTSDGSSNWCLKLRHMSFESGRIGVIEKDYQFSPFSSQIEIANLPAVPSGYIDNAEQVREELIERGKKYVQLCWGSDGSCLPVHKFYKGPVWIQRQNWKSDGCEFFDHAERTISNRVIVDPVGYVDEHPVFRNYIVGNSFSEFNSSIDPSSSLRSEASSISEDDLETGVGNAQVRLDALDPSCLMGEELMTFPSRIGGYSLVTKDAGFFLVDELSDVAWESERAEDFRQSSQKMEAILRIASGFCFLKDQFGYHNKGAGLTFLLFGPPGVGKTLTAECVAEALRRPLYRINGSEIGDGVGEIESRLTQAFTRTARWGAILLFDEAETFMARRGIESLERNAVVACLLRFIEYHTGIVILTTNRIADFDEAFHSRIHVSLEYTPLNTEEKVAIWRKETRERLGGNHAITEDEFQALAQLDLDGRTICNAVHVLKLFMEQGKGEIVSIRHVKQTLELASGKVQGQAKKQLQEFCRT